MKRRLAIFDFDGTLYDTCAANAAAYTEAMAPYGRRMDEQTFARRCNGGYYKRFLPPILGTDDPQILELVHEAKLACYPKHFDLLRENEALFALLEALRPAFHTALVSTAATKSVRQVLTRFGRLELFDLILGQQEIPRKKPDPCGFELAMAHFGVDAAHTLIFEDSKEGLAAAAACGAACLAVPWIRREDAG